MKTPAFASAVEGAILIRSVATLADEPLGLTCSVAEARRWARQQYGETVIHGYPSFEEAADAVRCKEDDALLVPSAYPGIKRFFFDRDLFAVQVYLSSLPDFVLVAKDPSGIPNLEVVYYHAATESLVDRANIGNARRETVSSNSCAARMAQESVIPAAAVTNVLCADGFQLEVIETLSRGTPMSFNIFTTQK